MAKRGLPEGIWVLAKQAPLLQRPPKKDVLFLATGLTVEPRAFGICLLNFGPTSNAGVLLTDEALTIGAYAPARNVRQWLDAFPSDLIYREGVTSRFVRIRVADIARMRIAEAGVAFQLTDGRVVSVVHPGVAGNPVFAVLEAIWIRTNGVDPARGGDGRTADPPALDARALADRFTILATTAPRSGKLKTGDVDFLADRFTQQPRLMALSGLRFGRLGHATAVVTDEAFAVASERPRRQVRQWLTSFEEQFVGNKWTVPYLMIPWNVVEDVDFADPVAIAMIFADGRRITVTHPDLSGSAVVRSMPEAFALSRHSRN